MYTSVRFRARMCIPRAIDAARSLFAVHIACAATSMCRANAVEEGLVSERIGFLRGLRGVFKLHSGAGCECRRVCGVVKKGLKKAVGST